MQVLDTAPKNKLDMFHSKEEGALCERIVTLIWSTGKKNKKNKREKNEQKIWESTR